jgi:hypothetical protein
MSDHSSSETRSPRRKTYWECTWRSWVISFVLIYILFAVGAAVRILFRLSVAPRQVLHFGTMGAKAINMYILGRYHDTASSILLFPSKPGPLSVSDPTWTFFSTARSDTVIK